MLETSNGADPVAKRQKNAYFQESVGDLVDAIQEVGGATYTRIMTAAILHYAFERFVTPEWDDLPESRWMDLAMQIERGGTNAEEVASRLLDYEIDWRERWAAEMKAGTRTKLYGRVRTKEAPELLLEAKALKQLRDRWKGKLKDTGSFRDAIKAMM